MSLSLAEFQSRFTEFGGITQQSYDLAMVEASNFVNERAFGCKACDALAYYAAHLFACGLYGSKDGCGDSDSAPGPLASFSAAGVSTTFAVNADDGELGATKYGRRFLAIKKTIFPGRTRGAVFYVDSCC